LSFLLSLEKVKKSTALHEKRCAWWGYFTGIPVDVFDENGYFSRNSYEIPSFEMEFQLRRFLW
jgi:hypothetical protein